jgi:hypothetical protein
MGVGIDAPREHVQAGCVDSTMAGMENARSRHRDDLFTGNSNVTDECSIGTNNRAAAYDQVQLTSRVRFLSARNSLRAHDQDVCV